MHKYWSVLFFFISVRSENANHICKGDEKCEEDSSLFSQISEEPVCYHPSLQSPIALDHSATTSILSNNSLLVFSDEFDSNVLLSLTNVGASARLLLLEESSVKPKVSGGVFAIWPPYQFQGLHIHVGDSEHKVDGKGYPIEAHAVHWNTKYSSYDEAKKQSDGLLVMAYFGEKGDQGTPNLADSLWWSLDLGESLTVTGKYLQHFLGDRILSHQPYFYYEGSLTTEPYSENVQWIVFNNPFFHMSAEQLKTFTDMQASSEHQKRRNIQCRNGRQVFYVPNVNDKEIKTK